LLAERLQSPATDAALIDSDPVVAARARARGLKVIDGSALDIETLERAGAAEATGFVTVTHSGEVNFQACLLARDHFDIEAVVGERESVADAVARLTG